MSKSITANATNNGINTATIISSTKILPNKRKLNEKPYVPKRTLICFSCPLILVSIIFEPISIVKPPIN